VKNITSERTRPKPPQPGEIAMDEPTPRRTLLLHVAPDDSPSAALTEAAALLRAGELVAFPTETVYGLGADATNPEAVRRIFAAKERPYSDPLIVHIPDARQLPLVAAEIPEVAWRLAARFWPGPLTLVVPRAAGIPALVAAGGATVGVRVPSHPVAQALLRAAEIPVAAPSANRFMHTSPTTAQHVLADLDGRIAAILDGGPSTVGVESTVLDLTSDPPRVLRPGGVTLEALRAVLPQVQGPLAAEAEEAGATEETEAAQDGPARAPGQMARHYAPRTPLVVFDAQGAPALEAIHALAEAALARGERVGVLLADEEAEALAHLPQHGLQLVMVTLGPEGDLAAISRRLYAALRTLDEQGLDLILAHTFGREGLGLALEDRLRRAAGGALRPI
jgi:L-threonylcarbamoyladenylate synthase